MRPPIERLSGVRDALEEVGLEAAVAVPLRVREELIGLLAVYPERGRGLSENEESLLRALAAQLAVAVENARLHERAERLGAERKEALDAEVAASKRLRALYDISRSFTESLSLDATLEAAARTIVESLGIDAAVLRMPDERGSSLVPVAVHVRRSGWTSLSRAILSLPQPLSPVRPTVFRSGEAIVLDADGAAALGPAHQPLIPFLEKGSTVAVIPLSTPVEILGTLTLLSLDSDRPIAGETLEAAISIAGQAALALDNARLYQQQKRFADTMQRSLLPRTRPQLEELEIGDVYDSSARVDVGGDVYDFLELSDGRLAVVLGDVTGHGIDATADMAMAKFVFRSLAREHPEPGDFLSAANEIVLEEIAAGKFITLLYLTVDGRKGELACASAGHPPPRLLRAGGTPEPLAVRGLALGIDGGQEYEEARVRLDPGDAIVLFTDGLLEARRDGELYGEQRLDAALAANAHLPAQALADTLLADCKAFAAASSVTTAPIVVLQTQVIDLARRDGRMLRIGHRGAAALAPENTIESLRLAIELGCDLVEFDVHEVEGALVLAHDQPAGPVPELPTLDEALAFLAGTEAGAHLDLKASGAEEAVADALRRHGLVERTVVSSFRPETLRALAAVEPGVRLGLTYPEDRRGLVQRRGVAPLIRPALGGHEGRSPAQDRAPARRSGRERGDAALRGGQRGRGGALPRDRRPGARLDRRRATLGGQARRDGRGRRDHERSAHLRG